MPNKKIIIPLAAVVFAIGAAVAFAVATSDNSANTVSQDEAEKSGQAPTTGTSQTTETANQPEPVEKPDTPGDSFPQPPAPDVPTEPSDTSELAYLSASVTAQQSLSDDSIDILFYVQGPSYFTVQELVSGSWVTLTESVYYQGSGGLLAGQLAPDEESKAVRLLKNENGQYTAVTSEFMIVRSEVIAAGGIKTYSG